MIRELTKRECEIPLVPRSCERFSRTSYASVNRLLPRSAPVDRPPTKIRHLPNQTIVNQPADKLIPRTCCRTKVVIGPCNPHQYSSTGRAVNQYLIFDHRSRNLHAGNCPSIARKTSRREIPITLVHSFRGWPILLYASQLAKVAGTLTLPRPKMLLFCSEIHTKSQIIKSGATPRKCSPTQS